MTNNEKLSKSEKRKTTKKSKTMKKDKCCKATFRGLNMWYVSTFEKLGWMILANERKDKIKIEYYKKNIEHLKSSIEIALEDFSDADKKRDLKIMWDNVMILIEHVKKDFK